MSASGRIRKEISRQLPRGRSRRYKARVGVIECLDGLGTDRVEPMVVPRNVESLKGFGVFGGVWLERPFVSDYHS
jgi:hypothetical protein